MRISDWSADVCSSDLVVRQTTRDISNLASWTGNSPSVKISVTLTNPNARVLVVFLQDALPAADAAALRATAAQNGVRLILTTEAVPPGRSEEHTSELQSLMRISYAVCCMKKKKHLKNTNTTPTLLH